MVDSDHTGVWSFEGDAKDIVEVTDFGEATHFFWYIWLNGGEHHVSDLFFGDVLVFEVFKDVVVEIGGEDLGVTHSCEIRTDSEDILKGGVLLEEELYELEVVVFSVVGNTGKGLYVFDIYMSVGCESFVRDSRVCYEFGVLEVEEVIGEELALDQGCVDDVIGGRGEDVRTVLLVAVLVLHVEFETEADFGKDIFE